MLAVWSGLRSMATGLPTALAIPAGAPWPVILTLASAGFGVTILREWHRHAEKRLEEDHRHEETLTTLRIAEPGLDATAVVAVLRGHLRDRG